MTNKERIDLLREYWGAEVTGNIMEAIAEDEADKAMTMSEFLGHCTACGGDWGGMLLTGVHKLWPHVWDAIPEQMGVYAWECICTTIGLCGVQLED